MRTTQLALTLLLAGAQAQKLTSVLAGARDLDDIKEVLTKFPAITNTLASAKDITIFLPRNGARGLGYLEAASEGSSLKRSSPSLVEATLTYHVVKGVFPAASVP